MIKIKTEIAHLEKMFDAAKCKDYYQITILTDDEPACRLGNCDLEIKQK